MSQDPGAIFATDDTELYAAFFQDPYYDDKLAQKAAGRGVSFNPFAFFLGIIWFLYRKMFAEAAVTLGVLLVVNFIEEAVFAQQGEELGAGYNLISSLVFASVQGMVANTLYLRKAGRTVQSAKAQHADAVGQLAYVKKKGGTSYLFVVLGIVALAAFVGAAYLYDQYL